MPPIDVVRTFLEMNSPDALRPADAPVGVGKPRLTRVEAPSAAEYRALYRAVGEAYHWRDRHAWSDERLSAYLADPDVALWVLEIGGTRAGYFELHRGPAGSTEIVYFGLTRPFIGRGLGKFLLTRAVEEGWRTPGTTRVWLHTCTLDDPAALPNYLARGFRSVKTERYTVDDDPAP